MDSFVGGYQNLRTVHDDLVIITAVPHLNAKIMAARDR